MPFKNTMQENLVKENTMNNLNETPLVSIIVRTKDRPKLLKKALESVFAQTYRPIEVVLVNDGGCDLNTGEIEAILGDISLNYIRLETNTGRANAGNVGIENTKGDFISFLDDDDVFMPEGIETLVNTAIYLPSTVIYGTVICKRYSADGKDIITELLLGSPFDKERLLLENYMPINSLCIPRDLLISIGNLDTDFIIYEDWDMLIRLAEKSNFSHIDKIVAEYCIFETSTLTGKYGQEFQMRYREKLLMKHFDKLTPSIILKFLIYAPHIKAKDHEIDHYVNEIKQLFLQNRELEQQKDFMNKLQSENMKELSAVKRERDLLSANLNNILKSRSWRYTASLRKTMYIFKGRIKKLAGQNKPFLHPQPIDLKETNIVHNLMPHVEVIIVNFNGKKYLDNCVSSLLKTDYPNFSITVVDNNSTDGSIEIIQEKYKQVKVIRNDVNLGFGAANEIAITNTDAQLIALLNNDTVVDPNWLTHLVKVIISDESIGAVSSKLLLMDNENVINNAGGGMTFTGFGYDIGLYIPDDKRYSHHYEILFPSGAACLIKRDVFLKIGGFDKAFFMYHEDVDLGWRIWLYGYRVIFVPESIVYHAFGGTSTRVGGSDFKFQYGMKHAMRSIIKNYEIKNLFKALFYFFILGIGRQIVTGKKAFTESLKWNVKMLPDTLRQRRILFKNKRIKDIELIRRGLIYRGLRSPAFCPDYQIINMKMFKESPNKRDNITIGKTDFLNLGYGWFHKEPWYKNNSSRIRWTMSEAVAYLNSEHESAKVCLSAYSLLSEKEEVVQTVSISVNNTYHLDFELRSGDFADYTTPFLDIKGPIEIKIRTSTTFIPHQLFLNNDYRELGIAIRKIWLEYKETSCKQPLDSISVIIPTYNRVNVLMKTLKALEEQTLSKDLFEVIVVDDGSTDNTKETVRKFIETTNLDVKYYYQENKKQGAARNLGIKMSNRPIILFIGDDIVPMRDFLQQHLTTHQQLNKHHNLAVLGQTKWPSDAKITPFLKFINGYGPQFGYDLISDGEELNYSLFYTSNISIPMSFLERLDYIFDEDFKTYGYEDIELGYRLQMKGMTIIYNSKAVAEHHHEMNVITFSKRQFNVGKAAHTLFRKQPQFEQFLNVQKIPSWSRHKNIIKFIKLITFFAGLVILPLDTTNIKLPHRIYDFILDVNWAVGYLTADEQVKKEKK